jgi:hypothetical protein
VAKTAPKKKSEGNYRGITSVHKHPRTLRSLSNAVEDEMKKVEKDSKPADEIEQSLFPLHNKNETMKQAASATLRAARRTPPTPRAFSQRPIASTSASLRSFSSSPLSRQQQQQETKEEPKEDNKNKKDEKKKPQEEDSTVEGRSPFAAFVEVLRDEVRKNREWQDSVKQLGGEVSKVQDSEAMKRAKEVYERARVRFIPFSSLSFETMLTATSSYSLRRVSRRTRGSLLPLPSSRRLVSDSTRLSDTL